MLSERDIQRLAAMPMVPHAVQFPVQLFRLAAEVAAWVFAPPPQALGDHPVVLDLYAGCLHDKRYWHFVPDPSDGSYSFAQYIVEHYRCIVIAGDHVGTGESTRPENGFALSLDALAEAHAQVVSHLRTRLRTGTLTPDLPQLNEFRLGAIGHGIGALLLQRVQARFNSYDALAFLGWNDDVPLYGNVDSAALEEALQPDEHGYVAMTPAERRALRPFFLLPDVPPEIVEADEQQSTVLPGGLLADYPGSVHADAATISVPIFLGYGEQDLFPVPQQEPDFYPRCEYLTLYPLPGSAHCRNLSHKRQLLWKAVGWWLQRLLVQSQDGVIPEGGAWRESPVGGRR